MNEILNALDYILDLGSETCIREEVLSLIDKHYKYDKCNNYVKAMLLVGSENEKEQISYENSYYELLLNASSKGCAQAQYLIANRLYENHDYEKAIELYKKSALQGYAPSQWCYGIDLFRGVERVLEKNENEGLLFIELSSGQLYEYAIDFLIYSYKNGNGSIFKNNNLLKKYKLLKQWAIL